MAFDALLRVLLAAVPLLLAASVAAQDYRSKASGNWNALSTWEQDNGSGWVDATVLPTNASGAITVRSPHTVTVSDTYSLDDVTIEAGATLTNTSGGLQWVLNNGTYGVKIFGTLNANSGTGSFGCCASVSIENGGVVNMNAGGAFFGPTTVQEGGTVNGNTSINLAGSIIVNNGTWTMNSNYTLTIGAGGSFTNNGNLAWKAGTLSGTLTNNGTVTWAGGTVTSSPLGTINNGPGATFTMTGGTAQNGAINNQGTFTWAGGNILSYTAVGTFLNTTGAVFNMTGVSGNNTFFQAVTNHGTINFTGAGTLTPNTGTTITNTGAININGGQWDWNHNTTHTGTVLIASGATLHLNGGSATFNAGTSLLGTGTLRISGNATQNCPLTISDLTVLKQGGTWTNSTGNPTVFAEGIDLTWSGGTFAGTGGYSIESDVIASFSSTNYKTLDAVLTNHGTINWSGGRINESGPGHFVNATDGTLNITFADNNNPHAVDLTNHGIINYTGAGIFNTLYLFTNNGTLNVNSGEWHFNGGAGANTNNGILHIAAGAVVRVNNPTTFSSTASVTGSGILRIANTLTQNFPWTVSAHAVELIGGTWTGTGAITFAPGGIFNWTAGTLSGTGNYTVQEGASISLYTTNGKVLNSTLTNNGTINWSGGQMTTAGPGLLHTATSGTLNITFAGVNQLAVISQNDGIINYNNAGTFNSFSNFTNNGTLNVLAGQWHFNNVAAVNNGVLHIAAGTVAHVNNSTTFSSTASVTGSGILRIQGTLTQNFPWTVSAHAVELIGGTWTGTGAITFAPGGIFNWTAGTLSGTGNYTVQEGASINLYTGNAKILAANLTNHGTIAWSGGQFVQNGTGQLINETDGILNISFSGINNPLSLNTANHGSINYTGTGTFNTINPFHFTNNGTLNVNSGEWHFNGVSGSGSNTNNGILHIAENAVARINGPTTFSSTASVTGSGILRIANTLTQNFPWTVSTHTVELIGGTWTGTGAITFAPGGIFNWTAGTLSGTGNYTIQEGASINLYTNNTKYQSNYLTNNGTIYWSGGQWTGAGTYGEIINGPDGAFNISVSGITNPILVNITNQGTVNYTGSGAFNTYHIFANTGTLNVNSGTWSFTVQPINSAGTINTLPGATVQCSSSGTLTGTVNNGGTFSGSLNGFTGPTFTNNGSVTLANLPFTGSAEQTLDGTGTITQLTLNNADGLVLGGTQTVTNTLALSNGKVTLGNNDLILTHATPGNLSGANASRYIVTNGTGSLRRQVTGANVPFPIGTASSYMPATISLTSGPAEAFGARVQEGVNSDYGTPGTPTGSLVQNHQVERTWVLSEQTDGDNQATVQLQWNTADEGADFDRGNSGLYSYNGTDWVALDLAAAGGSNPYTRSAANVALFREFTVADGESTLPVVCDNGLVPGAPCDDGDPNTGDDAVDASCTCAGTPLEDCEGVPGGIALPGTACDDGNANTGNDAWDANCNCTGQLIDCLGVVGGTALPGTACNDGDPSTSDDAFSGECLCIGSPLNDDVCNAIAITMGMNGPFSNVGATLEPGESVPPTGDCWTWCVDADQTVWFTFTAPASGRVSLNFGPNGPGEVGDWDSQIALWAAPDCAALTSGGATLLVANDKVASFLQDAQINPICLTPGQTYYVQVDAGYEPNAAFELHLVDEALDATIEVSPTEVPFEGEAYVLIQGNYDATVLYTVNGGTPQSGTLPGGLLNIGTGPLTADVTYELLSMELDGCTTSFTGRTATITVLSEPDCAGVPGGSAFLDSCAVCVGGTTGLIPCVQDCNGVWGGPVLPGTPCNDGDACTINDVLTAGCGCAGAFQDSDNDGTCDTDDGCPNDPLKTSAGTCGCGNADVAQDYYADTDGDGFGAGPAIPGFTCDPPANTVTNNADGCPTDPLKSAPGACGCGNADTDSDGDSTADCIDGCPNDPLKTSAGACGCGNPDTDSDGDNAADCVDGCPNDPLKTSAGACGCGNLDTDSDGDLTADCIDGCPNDPLKTNAGACGCGNADTDSDGDGVPDCIDPCPAMPGAPGDACNDGNPATSNDQVQADCTCAGEPVDCAGVPNGLHQVDNCGQCLLPTDPNFVSATFGLSFSGNPGFTNALVSPVSGAPDDVFTAEAVYTHSGNEPLPAGWPRLLLDFEGNGSFADANDRTILMTAVDPADATTSDGKLYRATFSSLPSGSNWQARIVAENGPCTAQIGPLGQPDVLIAPDLEIFASDISFSTANPAVSSPLTVYATLRNNSDLAAQNFTVHLVNQFNPGTAYTDILVGYLAPHGSTTVSWNITTPGVPAWCPMQVFVDYGNVLAETNELNNSAIRPFTNGDYNVPGAIDANASANPADAYQGTTMSVHIQGQAQYSGTAVPLADPSVAGGQVTVSVNGVGTFYGLTDASGHYDVPVPANGPLGQTNVSVTVTDFTLTSNTATTQYTQHPPLNCLPDLTVQVGVAPGAVVQGGTVTATVTVTNTGCANAPASTTALVSNAGLAVAQLSVPALATGASYSTSVTTDPLGTPGAYVICATADGLFQIEESSEQNEQCAAFSVLANAPDLVPGAPQVTGDLACSASAPQFSVTNAGAANAGAFNVAVRIKRDGSVVFAGSHAVPGLTSLQTETWTVPFTYGGPGLYQFEVDVDTPLPNGSVAESNEVNNAIVLNKNLGACIADLAIAGCTGLSTSPAAPAFPGTVTYQAEVVNTGTATANGPINVAFHVSGQGTLTASYPGNLAPGASAMVQVSTASVAPGTATLTATVDPDDLLEEDAEANNSASMAICSDLRPQPICGPWGVNFWENSYVINSTLLPRIGILSEGLYGVAQAKVRFDVAGPGIGGTVNLGDATLNNVGRTCGCPLVAALPNTFLFTQAGTYTFTITVDPDDVNVECSEANNVMVRHITVTNLPDLRTLSQHIAPSLLNPDVNEPITFDVTYENIGNGNPGDILGMTVEVDGLPFATVGGLPGLLSGGSHSVAIPGNFASNVVGVHTVRAVIDDGNDVIEGDELNNEATRTFVVGPAANLFFQAFASNVASPAIGQSIQVQATVANGGSAPINAAVLFCYVNAANDTVPFGLQSIELAELGSTSLTQPWTVTQLPVTVVGRIVNATGLEFNYEDNSASFVLGTFNVTLTATAACMAIPGTLQATVSGGTAPYTFNWSNGAQGDLLTAVAGNYIVGVTDANGVFASASGTIDNGSDSDNDGTPDCVDLCPNDPDKTDPGTCGCGTADVATTWYADADGDGLGDPNDSQAGFTCNQPAGFVADNTDACPAVSGTIGSACNDGNPNTTGDALDASCNCVGTAIGGPCTGDQVVVSITTDANPGQLSWEILDAGSNVIASGSPATANATVDVTACLGTAPVSACYGFKLLDSFGDGIIGGGWELRTTGGKLILRDEFPSGGASPASPSQSPAYGAAHGFSLPLGPANIAPSECGIFDNQMNNKVYAVKQSGTNYLGQTLKYQFEFSDPDAGFIRRIAKTTNYVNFWDMASVNPLTPGVTYFARVRTDKSGPLADAHWGTGCEMAISTSVTGCPQLIQAPAYGHSCNETRSFNTNNSFIYATPVEAASQYEFRIYNAGEGYDQTFVRNTYILQLKWNSNVAPPLVNGSTYSVEVRAMVSGMWGSYCGNTCVISIDNGSGQRPGSSLAQAGNATLWPNPVRDGQVNLAIDGLSTGSGADAEQQITVDVQDLFGKRVFAQEFSNSGERFTTILQLPGDIASGVYLVNITVNGQSTVQRLSIVR